MSMLMNHHNNMTSIKSATNPNLTLYLNNAHHHTAVRIAKMHQLQNYNCLEIEIEFPLIYIQRVGSHKNGQVVLAIIIKYLYTYKYLYMLYNNGTSFTGSTGGP